ncbi:Predicted NAD/FAD-binding protein [Nocardioides scoriae]|uniref:Predicted NAD/FAD-binding protein n=1 Tax=Nocardioides scoriae TaxID=642780 RepID=A0A1H1SZX3_9ACTN|nr:FAD-dependent oxidoreductase [Nocardioides scoriae]SDS53471.1 Predicted NAD/FAD-binding protein [Nocardioides scoriae]
MTRPAPDRVAVIGSGVAGLLAAHVLARGGVRVTLLEADARLGGHADTHEVETGDPAVGRIAVDTGFIVHNHRTYPHLLRLFDELGVSTQESEMSMSVRADAPIDRLGGLEYAGALGAGGLFPSATNLRRPAYLRMLVEIPRFHRMAHRLLEETDGGTSVADDGETLGDFLDRGGFSPLFRTHFMESLVACVWSCDPEVAREYPARYLFSFLRHHGMLGVFGSPTWRTVTGGSREYVGRVAAGLDDVRTSTKVTSVLETADGVQVTDGNGEVERFDAVVVATHPGQALGMLAEPTALQAEVLSAMPYSPNTAQLHTDTSVLPRLPRARASWNYLRRASAPGRTVTVTYDMTRLMRLPVPADGTRYLVTLGGEDLVDQSRVIATMQYEHPIYTPASVAAQRLLPEIDTERVVFAGAYHGWGFHEDGARSGVDAAARLGVEWGPARVRVPALEVSREPTAYATTIRHTRRRPFRRSFSHRSTTWLVDLDHLPDHGVLRGVKGSFEARDHLGDPDGTLKGNVEHFLRLNGVETDGGRIVMAANARALGHCFNPISVFWCHRRDGDLAGVVVEVHNTYGDRHAYLVHPDEQGRARTEKQMYVSPFHGTDGWYDVAVPTPGQRLRVAVTLHTDDGATFSASLDGERSGVSALRAAPAALRHTLLIHVHGVWLWARRLGIRPRPEHPRQEGVTS